MAPSADHVLDTSPLQPLHSSDLIASLPAPLLRLLVILARPIAWGRVSLEVLLWRAGRRVESWMIVAAWWGVCLGGPYAFRWLLPPMVFLPLLPLNDFRLGKRSIPPKHSPENPTTHEVLLHTLADLHAIHALLPPSPLPSLSSLYTRFSLLGPLRLARGLVILWLTWLTLGQIVGYSAMLGLVGSILLLLPSPFLAHTLSLLSQSLFLRRLTALIFLLIFGSPPDHSHPISLSFSPTSWLKTKWATSRRPSLAFTFRPSVPKHAENDSAIHDDDDEDQEEASPIYFRFEVHENQRWWMGLDWTSALLPQERPSWCDSHLLPVSPPASYPLPAPSSIILPHPTKADPNGQVKRIAEWRWLDDDWSIVRAGHGAVGSAPALPAMPVMSPTVPEEEGGYNVPANRSSGSLGTSPTNVSVPAMDEPQTASSRAQSIAEQAFTKGLERLKARTTSPAATTGRPQSMIIGSSPQRNSGEFKRGRLGSFASEDSKDEPSTSASASAAAPMPTETIVDKDDATDADGWVYGDNKWESVGPRGGLGKFTRRRRWHRRAVLTETIIRLPSETANASAPTTTDEPPRTPLKAAPVVAPQSVLAETTRPSRPDRSVSPSDSARRRSSDSSRAGVMIPPSSPTTSRDDVLRQRLKKAMGNMGG